MTSLIALALTLGAAPQTATPPAPAAPVATFDGNWTVVYAENVGKPVQMPPTLAIQNGTATINLGQPVTYRFDVGPGHAVQARPATASVPGATAPVVTPPAAPPAPPAPAATTTGPKHSGLNQPAGWAPSDAPRLSPDPGTLQGVFILSQDYLCLSLSPVGTTALGSSPGTVSGTPAGNVAAPASGATLAPPVTQAGPNAAGGGVRQDAFVLVLKRAPVR
jgi:hypothetical protein